MSATTGISISDFLAGDWPPDAQLVDGEVIVNDPSFEHQRIAGLVFRRLAEWVDAAPGRGLAGFGGNWTIAPGSVYKPDAWWVADARRPDPAAVRSDTPPDLVVEVRSPGTWALDLGPKRSGYEASGVTELWLVDPPARSVLIHRRSHADVANFDVAAEVGPGGTLTTPLLDGFALPIDELFAGRS